MKERRGEHWILETACITPSKNSIKQLFRFIETPAVEPLVFKKQPGWNRIRHVGMHRDWFRTV